MFRTRNFIEGVILGGISAIPALFIPVDSFNTRVMLLTAFAAPLFLIGNNGFNGDPLSTTVKNARKWLSSRKLMLYNSGARALKEAPLTVMMERPQASDKILDVLDSIKEARREKAAKIQYIEGETFEFAEDSELAGNYADDAVTLSVDAESFEPTGVIHTDSGTEKQNTGNSENRKNRENAPETEKPQRKKDVPPTVEIRSADTADITGGVLF